MRVVTPGKLEPLKAAVTAFAVVQGERQQSEKHPNRMGGSWLYLLEQVGS